jgi:hypothetical protein
VPPEPSVRHRPVGRDVGVAGNQGRTRGSRTLS